MRHALGMCFNWKVLAGLAAVGVALFVLAPGAALAALPLLLLAACPLSMGFMMYRMRGHGASVSESCHHTEGDVSVEAKRARLAALKEEEHRLELELSANTLDSPEVPAPATAPASPSQAAS